jgi:hypothetical protein
MNICDVFLEIQICIGKFAELQRPDLADKLAKSYIELEEMKLKIE